MDPFVVSARKYRPLRWADVMGQEHISNTLKNALKNEKVAHAFLFCGPRGVGKTTCARILARVLNCENPTADWEPCNECKTCIAFQENTSFNIFELDAASNNSVEDIRGLIEHVRYQPQYGKFKIYIVDEVHMLSQQAFNAFLKTLEEPPPYAKFILATTEKHKILPTILSRCQIYDFKRISDQVIVQQLQMISDKEKITSSEDALYLIAQKSDGGMRDALSMFDRIVNFSGKNIARQDVLNNLNILDDDNFFQITEAFLTENRTQALILLDQLFANGFDVQVITEGLANHMRNLFVTKEASLDPLLNSIATRKQKFAQQADACSETFLLNALYLINESEINLIRANNRRLHIEILFLKLCSMRYKIEGTSTETNITLEKKKSENIIPESLPEIRSNNTSNATPSENISEVNSTINITNKPVVELKSNLVEKKNAAAALPKLMDIGSLRKKINEEDIQKKTQQKELNLDSLLDFWEQLKSKQDSQLLRVNMNTVKLQLNGNIILIKCGSMVARESIRQELNLEESVRKYFNQANIQLTIEVDPQLSEREDKPKKIWSSQEKYDAMLQTNPKLQNFVETLGLKIVH